MFGHRLLPVLVLLLLPGLARANFTFGVVQDLSSLWSSPTPPGPFYLAFSLNSGDNGFQNNAAYLFDFGIAELPGLAHDVSLVGAPVVLKGNASGSLATSLTLQEGGASMLGDVTQVIQKISIDAPSAKIGFLVDVTDNFAGGLQPDTFTYQILYDDPLNPGNLVPVITTLVPGNIDFAQYSFIPGSTPASVLGGGPLPGFNPSPLDGIGPVSIIPEPTTMVIWGIALSGVAAVQWRRKRMARTIQSVA